MYRKLNKDPELIKAILTEYSNKTKKLLYYKKLIVFNN